MENEQELQRRAIERAEFWQTRTRGANRDEYEIYRTFADDGKGGDITTGKPLKSYEEWLSS